MKIIDAHTGVEVEVGQRIPLPGDGYYELTHVYPGIFSASADAIICSGGKRVAHNKLPLRVRWMHPGFPFRHIAFVPS